MPSIIEATNSNQARDFRTFTASTKVTEIELRELEQAAASHGMRLGEWVRDVLFRETKAPTQTTAPDIVAVEHILTEIVGLQMFLTDALSPIVCGGRLTSAEYEELMRNVKSTKRHAAQHAIAQFRAEAGEGRHG